MEQSEDSSREECVRCGARGAWVRESPAAGKSHLVRLDIYDQSEFELYGYDARELCQGCYIELNDENITLADDVSFQFFYSAASHTSREVLKYLEETNVLVSYATQHNGRLGTEHRHFVDCGGDPQSFIRKAELVYDTSHEEYLEYVRENANNKTDRWALRDYPVTDGMRDVFETSGAKLQQKTTDAHIELLDRAEDLGIKSQPVAVLQGESTSDYIEHFEQLKAHGALPDCVAVGGIATLGPDNQQDILLSISEQLSGRYRIHGFGVNLATLQKPGVVEALTSADSGYWYARNENASRTDRWGWDTSSWMNKETVVYQYLDHRQEKNKLLAERFTGEEQATAGQQTLADIPS